MKTMKKTTKKALAAELGIARSTLYYKPKKPPSDEALKQRILQVMKDNPAYGHKRVAIELAMNRKKVRRVMRKYGLYPRLCRKRKAPHKPDDMGREEVKIPNILKEICPIAENVVGAGDFTYFWFCGRFWYVATVIDVFTREILGWNIGCHHTSDLIIEAFKDAVKRTGKTPQYFHSDQGSEYVSGSYGDLLKAHGVTASFSKKSSPWQNGHQESFYNNFKLELEVERLNEQTGPGILIEAVCRQIHYYNHKRIHTSLDMPPIAYRDLHRQKQTAYAALQLPSQLALIAA